MNPESDARTRLTNEIQDMQAIVADTEYELNNVSIYGLEQEIHLLNLVLEDDVDHLNNLKQQYQQLTKQEYTENDF